MNNIGDINLSFELSDPIERECFEKLNKLDIIRRTVFIVDLYKRLETNRLSLLEEKLLEILRGSVGIKDNKQLNSLISEIKKESIPEKPVKENVQNKNIVFPDMPDVSIPKNYSNKINLIPKNSLNDFDLNDELNSIVDKSF